MPSPTVKRSAAKLLPAALALVLAAAPPALCQSQEFKLDDSRQWQGVASPEPGTDAATIAEARRLLAQDDPAAAQAVLDPWLEANRRAKSPYIAEALLLRGDALTAQDREFKALYDYEDICKNFPQSAEFPLAVERELEIAIRYAYGLKLRIFGFRWADSSDVAEELLIRVQERLPKSQAAEKAAIELADFYYRRRDLAQAHDMYDLYLQNFPTGPNSIKARQRRIQSDVGRFKGPRYNAAELINARVQVQDFIRRYPVEADSSGMNEALVARLDESMAAQLLDTGRWYLRVGDEPSARVALRRLVRDHPRTLSALRGEELMRERGWLEPTPEAQMPSVEPSPESPAGDPPPPQPDQETAQEPTG
ncbi:MAG: outer membrane protein assembly factor BamD [Planctomycetota bacterium]|nr:outer membrane protein assembly factor BamD [Planctomycetota bacterium]